MLQHVKDTPAARTLARRLERAGYADTDHEATAAWIETLRLYETLMAREVIMATFSLKGRTVDEDGVVTVSSDAANEAAFEALADAVDAFDAIGEQAGALITRLEHGLAKIRVDREPRLVEHWLALRRQLRDLKPEGWRKAIVCRQLYRVLPPASQRAAVEAFGPFVDEAGYDSALWSAHWPAEREERLDAAAANLDPFSRATDFTKDAARQRQAALAAIEAR